MVSCSWPLDWEPQLGTSFTVFLPSSELYLQHWLGVEGAEQSTEVDKGCKEFLCTPLCPGWLYIIYVKTRYGGTFQITETWTRIQQTPMYPWCMVGIYKASTCAGDCLITGCCLRPFALCLFAPWDHRPSTKERHRFLSVAILSISLLVYPISFVSFSVSLCQVFRGLSLRLFPGGFHVMAWRVMISGGFLSVSTSIFSSLFHFLWVVFQRVVLDNLSVHFKCKILHRHLLVKVYIIFNVFCVLRHVSDP